VQFHLQASAQTQHKRKKRSKKGTAAEKRKKSLQKHLPV